MLRNRPQEIGQTSGCGAYWKKVERFEKIENLSSVFQNGLAFVRQIGKASLYEFPEIYGLGITWIW